MNRRSFFALAALFAPERVYSFVGGWALPAAFIELTDGRLIELARMPAFVDSTGIVRPWSHKHMASGYIARPRVSNPVYFAVDSNGAPLGYAGNKPRESIDLRYQIARCRAGGLESWWRDGKIVDQLGMGAFTDATAPRAYL